MNGGRFGIVAIGALACAAAPACRSAEPYPNAILVVDTDLDVPRLASHLRVDVFDAHGTWRSSRELALRSPLDFPASFAVLDSGDASAEVVVRLRLRPDGAERDYRGERFRAAPDEAAPPAHVEPVPRGDDTPRLVDPSGVDRTPPREPLPELSVDRIVVLPLSARGTKRRVVLRGACAGRMADLASRAGCIDEGQPFAPATAGEEDGGGPSLVGTFGKADGVAPPVEGDAPAAVVGGAFVLGGDDLVLGAIGEQSAPSFPPRLVTVSSFRLDRREVTVAELRAAIRAGLRPPVAPFESEAPLGTSMSQGNASCTYTSAPDPKVPERDAMPATCIAFDTARAYCKYKGGDLPTEAQWEYAAAVAHRPVKSRFPWGEAAPTCEGVLFARADDPRQGDATCFAKGFPFGLRGDAPEDVSPDGIRALGGSVAEWVLGAPLPYDAACWEHAGRTDPLCDAPEDARLARGGTFTSGATSLLVTGRTRVPKGGSAPTIGFRCAHAW